MNNLLKKIGYIPIYFKLYLGIFRIILIRLCVTTRNDNSNRWLILERGNDAQDNAWHFFKYMIETHPEIDVRYAIKKSSPDFERNLKEYADRVLEYDSFKYYCFLFNSSAIISTHLKTWTPKIAIATRFQKSRLRYKGKIVFLQHGITHQEMRSLRYPNQDIDLFISGAKNEFELLAKNLNYPDGVIQYTGFARYDNLLHFVIKKQILIMPTWRAGYPQLSVDEFKSTDFFRAYSDILSNEKLLTTLRRNGYIIAFYNHYEFQKYNACFEQFTNDVVTIVQFGAQSVQDLIKESAAVVTDYSSIYYDVLYMNKPIIFFQFDKETFDTTQYGHNYDDASEFGVLTTTSSETIYNLSHLIDSKCVINDRYKLKAQQIFTYRDTNNCQRIFEAITKL